MRIFNLSRALRPKQFSQVVGQDLVVKILCNSLALNKIFPTYIFSGQRGLGKTTCARIFASAVLCHESQAILKNKSIDIPCQKCQSCQMFMAGKHPDFIEIDAASNPGVENVREILENALLTPVVGAYKIYLIDEVHMLSKAAFNAFLKMLEEPPSTACFLMATTDIQKVPDTIRSRALQLLFWPAQWQQMIDFLDATVKTNNLDVQKETLSIVTKLSEGSYRDALNRLEQVSLLENLNSAEQLLACKNMFGVSDNKSTIELINLLLKQDLKAVVAAINEKSFLQCEPAKVFQQILETLNLALEIKISELLAEGQDKELVGFANANDQEYLMALASFFWTNEEFFYSSKNKDLLIKNLIIRACKTNLYIPPEPTNNDNRPIEKRTQEQKNVRESGLKSMSKETQSFDSPTPETECFQELEEEVDPLIPEPAIKPTFTPTPTKQNRSEEAPVKKEGQAEPKLWDMETTKQEVAAAWDLVVQETPVASDKLLVSILKQAKNIKVENGRIALSFAVGGDFFKSKIQTCEKIILAAAQKAFPGEEIGRIEVSTEAPDSKSAERPKERLKTNVDKKPADKSTNRKLESKTSSTTSKNKNITPDLDEKQWPKSSLMVNLFEGSVESE